MNRKKWGTVLFLALLLTLSLTACQGESREEGLVVEVQTDEAGDVTAFVVEDYQGERTGVRLAEGTRFWPRGSGSWTDEELRAVMREELREDAWVYAYCHPRREKLETADGGKVPAYWATSVQVRGGLKREAAVLRDGTALDVLELDDWRTRRYRLADGTELLEVDEPWGPEDYYVGGLESFDDLGEAAKEKVRQYYEDRGLLYDETEELERCYAAWKELGEEFRSGHIQQTVTPGGSSQRVMYFTTELLRPKEYGTPLQDSTSFQDAFDRRTGERLDTWDLFAVPEAEVRSRLPELVDWDMAPAVREAMKEVMKPEWIQFTSDGLQIEYPAGSLPGEELDYFIFVNAKDLPEGFVQPWAVPAGWEDHV